MPNFWYLTTPLEGQQLRYCGSGVGYDDVIIDGNPEEMKVGRCVDTREDPIIDYNNSLSRITLRATKLSRSLGRCFVSRVHPASAHVVSQHAKGSIGYEGVRASPTGPHALCV